MPVQSLYVQTLQLLTARPVTMNEASPGGGASASERWVKRILASSVSALALVALPAPISAQTMNMPGMTMPTAIIVGEEDYATPVAMAEELHRGIAGSTLTVLPGARHLTPLEVPAVIADALLALAERAERKAR